MLYIYIYTYKYIYIYIYIIYIHIKITIGSHVSLSTHANIARETQTWTVGPSLAEKACSCQERQGNQSAMAFCFLPVTLALFDQFTTEISWDPQGAFGSGNIHVWGTQEFGDLLPQRIAKHLVASLPFKFDPCPYLYGPYPKSSMTGSGAARLRKAGQVGLDFGSKAISFRGV